jgi:hypothetical protein
MNRHFCIVSILTLATGLAVAGSASACGESSFNAGRGLEYQAYLAPRPATVVIYGTPDPSASPQARKTLLAGLEGAGHHVVIVEDPTAYALALQQQKVDLVIADAGSLEALAAANGTATAPRVVPVLAGRDASAIRGRFDLYLRAGAGLGQYLRAIDKAVAALKP